MFVGFLEFGMSAEMDTADGSEATGSRRWQDRRAAPSHSAVK